MRNNPERTAWIILLSAFGIFCSLSILIPASIRWYVINAAEPFETSVTSVRGTVLIGDPSAELSPSLTDGNAASIQESFTVSTDNTSQAILNFFDDSSLTLYSDTSILLLETREPSFSFSSKPTEIVISLQKGRVRATSARGREDLTFDIKTPHATIQLDQGSFSIEVSANETQVTTRLGQAQVISGEHLVALQPGQRVIIGNNEPPSSPLPAAQNLLSDGNFTSSFAESWEVYIHNPIEVVTTTVEATTFQNRNVLVFNSQGADNVHTEIGVRQEVNKDVRDFQSLRVSAEIRLVYQSLQGGGLLGSEFPIMLRLDYKDADNNDRSWYHGFYYLPPPENYILYNQPDNSSERVARFIWYPYESVNLLSTLGPAKPVFVKSIQIYASGWVYESMVSNVSLLAQE
jgi:hypothetical protein